MKNFFRLLAVFVPVTAFAAESAGIDVVVTGIPAGATEVVVVVDTSTPPPPSDYPDPAAAPVAAPLATVIDQVQAKAEEPPPAAAPADPAAADPAAANRRRRRGGGGRGAGRGGLGAPAAIPPVRQAVASSGATSVTVHVARAAADNYRVRAIAIGSDGRMPAVLAGAHADGVKVVASETAPVALELHSPSLKLAPDNPVSVVAGAKFTLSGTITDAGRSLGTKDRMRIWVSENSPPEKNYAGTQTSTVEVTSKGDDVEFRFNLTAPKNSGTLYFQFGEVPPDFARDDGTQAPLLVLPNLATGGVPLQLRVEAPALADKS